jgi:tetratricopeptide (TPR) repeat protein
MRKFNVKLFLVLMGIAVVLAAGLFGVSYVQKPRIARALLWQARRQEDQGETRRMAKYLQRYLEFVPNDQAEKAHLGRVWTSDVYEKEPRTRLRGMDLLTQVLAKEPDQPELRRTVVKTALDPAILDTKTARDHLEILWRETQAVEANANPRDLGELESLWGQLFEAERKPLEAAPWYRKAAEHAPAEQQSYIRLAYLLRHQKESNPDQAAKNIAEADGLMDQLVERNGLSYKAYVARWHYHRNFDLVKVQGVLNAAKIEEFGEDVKKALERAPEEVEVLIAAADKERLLGAAKADPVSFAAHRDEARKLLQTGLDLQTKPGYKGASDAARFQLLWHLANLQLDVSTTDLARKDVAGDHARQEIADAAGTIDQLKAIKDGLPAASQYLEARLCLHQGKWGDAATLFEQARPMLKDRPELQFQTDLFLSRCFEKLEQPGRQYAVCERAAVQDPNSVAARVGMAKAQWALGRMDEAVTNYSQVLARDGVSVEELLDVARMQVQRQLVAQQPDWSKVEPSLARAEKASGDHQPHWVAVQLLRAEVWAAQVQFDKAVQVLDAALQKYPKDLDLWTAKAFLKLKQEPKDPSLALAVLDDAAQTVGGDPVDLRQARARIAVEARIPTAESELRRLKEGTDKYGEEDRSALLEGLAQAWYVLGNLKEAQALWQEMSRLPPHANDLRLRLLLFDLAMAEKDKGGMDHILADIRRIEGAQGTFAPLGEALRLIYLSREGKVDRKAALAEARLQLDQVRTPWPRVALARAEIAELSGSSEESIAHLKQAIELGENSPKVIQRLVDALVQRQRYAEADQELHRLRESLLVHSELGKMAAVTALKQGNTAKALELAAINTNTADYRDLVWQARLLFVAKKDQEAFAKLQDAIKQAEHEPDPRVALVQFFHARGRDAEARQAVQDAELKITGEHKAVALARCYETVGDFDRARTNYDEALTRDRGNIAVIRNVCGFYLKTGRLEEIAPLLETIVNGGITASPADQTWARQSLAYVLSATTDFARFRRALDLVGVKLDDDGKLVRNPAEDDSPDGVRAKARVLATQSQAQFRQRAIELLEQPNARQSLLPDDRFVLALLYESQGDSNGWRKAREHLQSLCLPVTQGETREYLAEAPRYLSRFVQGLIRHGELAEAAAWLTSLEFLEKQRDAKAGAFGAVELRARLLEADKRGDEALALLRTYCERKGAQPSDVLLLVACYQRQQRFVEGLDLLDRERDHCPPEIVGGYYVSLMYGIKPTDLRCQTVETWLKGQIAKREDEARSLPSLREKQDAKARSVAMQMHLAALFDVRGHYDDARDQYRKILQVEPNNVVALNNLAWLQALGTGGDGQTALREINTAIAGMGRQSLLLDTRGLVYQQLGQNDKALADFKEAAEDAPTPTILFHLARAHHLAKDRNTAADILRQARKAGLDPAKLHPTEQMPCSSLMKELQID